MSESNIQQVLEDRKSYLELYPGSSEQTLDKLFPLPTPSAPAHRATTAGPSPGTNSAASTGRSNGVGALPGQQPVPRPQPKMEPAPMRATAAPPSRPTPVKGNSQQLIPLTYRKLVEAEKRRQESIRQEMAEYLRQYPSENAAAEKIYLNSGKDVVYPVVVEMIEKKVPIAQIKEALDFYSWLGNHEPTKEEDSGKRTLLHHAVLNRRVDLITLLLDAKYKAKVTAVDDKGYCLLHVAAKVGDLECLELVYKAAPQCIDTRDSDGRTPVMVAAFFNQHDAALKLAEKGSNLNAQDKSKCTAVELAEKQGFKKLAKALKAFQDKQTSKHARGSALNRWVQSDPLHYRLYQAWRNSTVPHTATVIDGFVFSTTAVHKVEEDNIEQVRMNRYDVSVSQRSYFAQRQRHSDLFLCLAYLGNPLICSLSDCQKALAQYEQTLRTQTQKAGATVEVNPLYFLACARLAKDDAPLRKLLLEDFVEKYSATLGLTVECGGWLTIDEESLLSDEEGVSGSESGPVVETIQDKWKAFAAAAKLTPEQCAPMDELLKLTGLATVKELALDLYMEGQENGFVPPTDQTAPREYNFAFLGNPGTGKTTVARILARILEATGLRAGHKVIEMTASDALRKGVQQFSQEIAALTGGDSSIAPPANPKLLRKGMNVEVKHGNKWFPATISNVQKSKVPKPSTGPPPAKGQPAPPPEYEIVGTYDLVYPDGTEDTDMSTYNGKDVVIRPVSKETAAGGVLFMDEAYDLDPANLREGRHIMADIMKVAEENRDRVSIILAGYKDDIENKLFAYNSGMRDRFRSIAFEDFDENELLEVWEGMCKNAGWTSANLPGQMSVSRVAARRLSQRRSVKGFANARSVRILCNQSITAAKRRPNHNKTLIVEDVVGVPPIPQRIPALAAALKQLEDHIGIKQVKEAVASICDVARRNYDKELNGMKTDRIPLNRLFLGNPGTGKTTVAAIYGQVLKHLNLLSKGDVIERKASDFIDSVVGGSEQKTKGILGLSKGCVLIIDEAYNLNDQLFGKVALNTIVENVNNAPGDDIAVIMIGYEKQMLKMLDEQNPGLRSRFDPAYAFRFEDFTDLELLQIFSAACARDQLEVPLEIKLAAVKHLAKGRCMKNFGNAREVMTLVTTAKSRMGSRVQKNPTGPQSMTLEDVLGEDAEIKANPLQCIEDLQGGDDEYGFRTVLRQLGNSINICRLENRPVDAVGNFIFTGAPGTGKTTVASKMAKMLNAFGVLATDKVIITTALDLTGQYVGQSKKVIEDKMEEARGGVLFIDEAYKLGEGSYGDEVMVKLLGMLTEPEYSGGKTIVILAGYDADMQRMLARNAGMASRFSERIHFADWHETQCVNLVESMANKEKPLPFHFTGQVRQILLAGFKELITRPNWANARDSETMYKHLKKSRDRRRSQEIDAAQTLPSSPRGNESALYFTDADARLAVTNFLNSRPAATPAAFDRYYPGMAGGGWPAGGAPREANGGAPNLPPPTFGTAAAAAQKKREARADSPEPDKKRGDKRDADEDEDEDERAEAALTAAQIAELERKQAAARAQAAADKAELAKLLQEEAEREAQAQRDAEEAARAARDGAVDRAKEEARKKREAAAKIERERAKARMDEIKKRQAEENKQAAIRSLGKCSAGYNWSKVAGGYRCAAGGHFIGDSEVEKRCKELFPNA